MLILIDPLPEFNFTNHSTTLTKDEFTIPTTVTVSSGTLVICITFRWLFFTVEFKVTITVGDTRYSFGAAYIPSAYGFSGPNIFIGDVTMSGDGYATRRTLTNSTETLTYIGNSTFYNLGDGSSPFLITSINNYYYVSALGHVYQFSGNKTAIDVGPGTLFIFRGSPLNPVNDALYSQYPQFSEFVRPTGGSSFQVTAGNGNVFFRFAGINEDINLTGSTVIQRTVAPISFDGSEISIGGQTINNISRLVVVGESAEIYSAATVLSHYDSYIISGRIAIFSNTQILTNLFQDVVTFLAGGGIPRQFFEIFGTTIRYAGVKVITLSQNGSTSSGTSPITYRYQRISRGLEIILNGIGFVTFDTSSTPNFVINTISSPVFAGTVGVYNDTTGTAFLTNNQTLQDSISSLFVAPPSSISTRVLSIRTRNATNVS